VGAAVGRTAAVTLQQAVTHEEGGARGFGEESRGCRGLEATAERATSWSWCWRGSWQYRGREVGYGDDYEEVRCDKPGWWISSKGGRW
jgi:hypothetical protein